MWLLWGCDQYETGSNDSFTGKSYRPLVWCYVSFNFWISQTNATLRQIAALLYFESELNWDRFRLCNILKSLSLIFSSTLRHHLWLSCECQKHLVKAERHRMHKNSSLIVTTEHMEHPLDDLLFSVHPKCENIG